MELASGGSTCDLSLAHRMNPSFDRGSDWWRCSASSSCSRVWVASESGSRVLPARLQGHSRSCGGTNGNHQPNCDAAKVYADRWGLVAEPIEGPPSSTRRMHRTGSSTRTSPRSMPLTSLRMMCSVVASHVRTTPWRRRLTRPRVWWGRRGCCGGRCSASLDITDLGTSCSRTSTDC